MWAGFEKLRNILGLVQPRCCTVGESVILFRHSKLNSLSFRVLKLLRPLARFLRSQAPVSRIS